MTYSPGGLLQLQQRQLWLPAVPQPPVRLASGGLVVFLLVCPSGRQSASAASWRVGDLLLRQQQRPLREEGAVVGW